MYYRRNYGIAPRTIGGLMEDVLHGGLTRFSEEINAFKAPVNISETETSYELHLVAPGLSKEDFKLNIDKDILNISYERKEEIKDETSAVKWLKSEFKLNSFKRSFSLNDKIASDKITAKYADGILVVSLPKKEVSVPESHEITVN